MSDDPKKLQQLKQSEVGTLEWSTWSEVHVTQAQALNVDSLDAFHADGDELAKSFKAVQSLQGMAIAEGIVALEWSTTSNVHVTKAEK